VTSLLLKVTDTFAITGRGLIVVPEPPENTFSGPTKIHVELRRPDGSILRQDMSVSWGFQTPSRKNQGWTCTFLSATKADVPIGTEIWYDPSPNTSLERTREG
jgi:hypothetical protein